MMNWTKKFMEIGKFIEITGALLVCTNCFAQPDTMWTKTYGGSDTDRGYSVQQCADNGFIIAGKTESFGAGYPDVYLIRVSSAGVEERDERRETRDERLEVYPNPFTHKTVISYQLSVISNPPKADLKPITLCIYDVTGRLIKTLVHKPMETGSYTVPWNAKSYPSGIYFAELKAGDYKAIRKLILMK